MGEKSGSKRIWNERLERENNVRDFWIAVKQKKST